MLASNWIMNDDVSILRLPSQKLRKTNGGLKEEKVFKKCV
jgi:hypothetical protein